MQVSGCTFAFDPSQPPGRRIVPGSVTVGGRPIEHDRWYRVATKEYIALGKDGYSVLSQRGKPVTGMMECPTLATMVRNHFTTLADITASRQHGIECNDPALVAYKARVDAVVDDGVTSLTAVYDAAQQRYAVAPRVEGRIRMVSAKATPSAVATAAAAAAITATASVSRP